MSTDISGTKFYSFNPLNITLCGSADDRHASCLMTESELHQQRCCTSLYYKVDYWSFISGRWFQFFGQSTTVAQNDWTQVRRHSLAPWWCCVRVSRTRRHTVWRSRRRCALPWACPSGQRRLISSPGRSINAVFFNSQKRETKAVHWHFLIIIKLIIKSTV